MHVCVCVCVDCIFLHFYFAAGKTVTETLIAQLDRHSNRFFVFVFCTTILQLS